MLLGLIFGLFAVTGASVLNSQFYYSAPLAYQPIYSPWPIQFAQYPASIFQTPIIQLSPQFGTPALQPLDPGTTTTTPASVPDNGNTSTFDDIDTVSIEAA